MCMAPFGGPVVPGIIVGGFPKPKSGEHPDYKLATGLILTFLIDNHVDKKRLEPAIEWELKFLNFMKNYTNDKMDIAYSAERSIQDGIEEISSAESVTVIISYLVMFIYVAFALGQFKGLGTFLV